MVRITSALACAALCFSAMAWAQEEDAVMGIYEGAFTSGTLDGQAFRILMVPRARTENIAKHDAVFVFDALGARVSVPSKTIRGATALEGEADLGDTGTFKVTGELADGAITGTFDGPGRNAKFSASKADKSSPTLGATPPDGAVVLFGGENADEWQRVPLKWPIVDGAMEVSGSNLATVQEFGDFQMHLEFRTPYMPTAAGQARGNSGVYILGRYEVQVLDSFGEAPADNLCGGIYKAAVPVADAALPPLQWQTYDIDFIAPKFDESGKKTANATITVTHNGIVVHENVVLPDVTPGGLSDTEGPTGPLMLQDHGNNVQFRNIWIVKK